MLYRDLGVREKNFQSSLGEGRKVLKNKRICVSQISITVTECLGRTTEMRKDLFWLMFQRLQSMVTTPLLWDGGEIEHGGHKAVGKEASLFMAARKQRQRKGEEAMNEMYSFSDLPPLG